MYVFASTISASVARADISTHANFIPLVNVLSDAEAVDDTSHVYGSVSGAQIADAIAAHGGGGGGTSVAVDGVVVGYVASTRTLGVEIEQDNGVDVSATQVLPLVSATEAGLLPTTGRICPDPSTGTAGQVCTVNAAEDGYELAGGAAAGSTDRIVLADAVGVSNTAGPHEITLTEAMVARQIITIYVGYVWGYEPGCNRLFSLG